MARGRVRPPSVHRVTGMLTSLMLVAAVTGVVALVNGHVPALYLLGLYVLIAMAVAVVCGTGLGVLTAVVSSAAYTYVVLAPTHSFQRSVVALGSLVVTAVVVGELATRSRRAALEATRLSEEQAALRRVATLVARAAPPETVFTMVTEEVGRLLAADLTVMGRYDSDGTATVVASWSMTGAVIPVGTRAGLGGQNLATRVFQTRRPARIDSYAQGSGSWSAVARTVGMRTSVGAPVLVQGSLWGVVTAGLTGEKPLPADAEARLADFTELVATAVANAESRAELTASRARVVASADATRRRIERDLHDGAQQRLVSLALQLRAAQAGLPADLDEVGAELDRVTAGLSEVMEELREMARGIHPAILAHGGLGPALKELARRCPIPVQLDLRCTGRLPESVEVAAYYVVSEALANAAKHARASLVRVELEVNERSLCVSVGDDGIGGADSARGSGLLGLKDRTEALSGTMLFHSPPGAGTSLRVELPLDGHAPP